MQLQYKQVSAQSTDSTSTSTSTQSSAGASVKPAYTGQRASFPCRAEEGRDTLLVIGAGSPRPSHAKLRTSFAFWLSISTIIQAHSAGHLLSVQPAAAIHTASGTPRPAATR